MCCRPRKVRIFHAHDERNPRHARACPKRDLEVRRVDVREREEGPRLSEVAHVERAFAACVGGEQIDVALARAPNEIGPGVYDIHSPNIPTPEHIVQLMRKAAERIPAERLWVNPDCGLKTRQWAEVIPALTNMVTAARTLRDAA